MLYDVLFAEADQSMFMVGETEWTGEESDQALVEATERAGNVVHVAEAASAGLVDPTRAVGARLEEVPALITGSRSIDAWSGGRKITPPFPALARAARAIGHSLVVYDPDGPLRRVVPFVRVTSAVGSFADAAAEAEAGSRGRQSADPLSPKRSVSCRHYPSWR